MMRPLTALQSLYWQSVDLDNLAHDIEEKIASLLRQGKKPKTLLTHRNNVAAEFKRVKAQMHAIEHGVA